MDQQFITPAEIDARANEILREVAGDPLQLYSRQKTVEPCRVITVRLPRSFHAALVRAGYRNELSLNRHCVRELLRHPETLADALRTAAEQELLRRGERSEVSGQGAEVPDLLRT